MDFFIAQVINTISLVFLYTIAYGLMFYQFF